MAEVVGGAILTALIQVLVEGLASPVVSNFFGKNHSVSKLLEKLKVKLRSANSLLNDAEDKQLKNDDVKNWVDVLNEVLNEADNAIDEVKTEALRCEIEGKEFLKHLYDPFEKAMEEKLEEIIGRLEVLLDEGKEYHDLKAGVPSHVYGRDGDKKAILDLLFPENMSGQDKISVIPIVGMGGVGKTTLARLVYNDSRVEHCFEHRAWVTVSDDFDVLKIAKLVFEGLSGNESKVTELGKLGEELEKFLGGKKFFLVLDDVWNENYSLWNSLNSYFQVGADGSKIIMTTRSEQIGSKMGSGSSHSLPRMEENDCWKLFQKHAFHSVEECTKQLETIGREIVKKCKGLPIAVVSLAGLLRSVSDPKEWEKVQKSDVWEIERKGDDEVLPSLWFSYNYLPSYVKRCFAYCSIFPKDYEYDKEKIMLLWMAEGLVQGENMEDVGEEYFKTLVSRSLLQRSANDESSFVMHDLVHDLATFVSGKDFCMRLGKNDGLERLTSKTRHLFFDRPHEHLKGLAGGSSLRTFISGYYLEDIPQEFPKKFGYLRVLSLWSFSIKKLPESIGKLKHLRYLDLSKTWIKELPDTICSLYNLQTLLLRNCQELTHLPAKMEKLIKLRHLDISETRSLKEIPQCVYNLKALRTITKFVAGSGSRINILKKFSHLRGCFLISGLENIVDTNDVWEAEFKEKSLVTELMLEWDISNNDSEKGRAILDGLQPHPNLKNLIIDGYGGTEFSDWVANPSFSNITKVSLWSCKYCVQLPPFGQLPSLKDLHVLGLESLETIGSEFYGSSGATPFPCLKNLAIQFMDKLQSWSFEAFLCLEILQLWRCPMLEIICLDPTHCLPSLNTLSIVGFPKLEINGCDIADSFPKEVLLPTTLTDLNIASFPNLKSLNGKGFQHLTSLMRLRIYNCPQLQSLPEEGLPTSLKWLEVSKCPKLEERLKRETGEDWHNISHIPNIEVDGVQYRKS